ncbi:TTN [Mytilus edulis]|uniref:TTN n=1 Tax=Mytilus edulis TaxID=6550 RepID=A0A8S3VP93_MYTED|nr:TTN [Mytilus edulis]
MFYSEYPDIRFDNTQYTAAIGTSVYMTCTIRQTRPSITEVWWVKGNSRIQADERKYEVRNGTTYTSLNVFNVNTNDAGEYKCYARNARGDMFANTTLATGNNPKSPLAAKDMYTVKEGTVVVLRCDPQTSIPPITKLWWQIRTFGHFHNLSNSLKYFDGTLTAPNLQIKDVRSSEAAEYTCNVVNTFGTSQVGMEVQLGKPPTVRAAADVYSPIRGRTTTLVCNIKMEQGCGKTTSSLTIRNIQAVDDGDYRCYGENGFGNNYDTVRVSSVEIPIISSSSNAYIGEYGEQTMLSVFIHDIYPKVYSIEWYHNDRHISRTYRYSVSNPNLTINYPRLEDSGTYVCRVGNGIGYANFTISLVIWRRPKVDMEGKSEITTGSDATFKCSFSESSPSMQSILWRKDTGTGQIVLEDGGKYVIQKTAMSTTLQIKSVTINDADTYTCIAVNKYSEGTDSFSLSVGSPPLINISQDVYIIKAGDNVNISCVIRNVPENYKFTMYWNKGSHRIINYKYNPFMIITIAKLVDAGNYSCHVRNKYGPASDSAELKVLTASIGELFQEVTANDSYTIRCNVSGGDRVIWRKNDKEFKLDDLHIYDGGSVDDSSLEIKTISHLNRGNYTCETTYKKYIPLVSLPTEIKEVTKGSDTLLDCSYDPDPTKVFWKKDDNIIKSSNTFRRTYNGSSGEMSVLVLHDTKQSDAGNYVCVVENSIGTGYSKILELIITDHLPSDRKEYAYKTPLIITLSVTGIILVCVGLMVCYSSSVFVVLILELIYACRRRQCNSNSYESPNFKQGDVHRYSTTRNTDAYDLPNIQTGDNDILGTTGSLGEKNEPKETRSFTVLEFLQLFNDRDKFTRHVQLEFKVSEFYPVSEKAIEMKYLRLELDSSEKKNKNLFVFHLLLTDKKTKFSTPVKIYKTTNWNEVDKHLPFEVLSQLFDVTRLSKSKPALLTNK